MNLKSLLPVLVSAFGLAVVSACSSAPKAAAPAPAPAAAATPAPVMKEAHSAPTPAPKAAKATKPSKAAKKEDTKAGGEAAVAGSVTCESAGDKRTIETKTSGEGCEVMYTKMDKATSVAQSHNDASFCSKKVAKIRENLEKAGFTCK